MGRNRRQRTEARGASAQELSNALSKIYKGTGINTNIFGKAPASSKEIADAIV